MIAIRVDVTADIIKRARDNLRGSFLEFNAHCPIALALCEALHVTAYNVTVYKNGFEIKLGTVYYRIQSLPEEVRERIETFDTTRTMAPFAFNVHLPIEALVTVQRAQAD